jgi:hypothetical protein
MALEHLTPDEQAIVVGCLRAVVQGPFFDDVEYHTMFGLERAEMAAILARWRDLPETDKDVFVGINNAMNNLLLWWGWQDENPQEGALVLQEWAGTSAEKIQQVYHKWLARRRGGLA